MTNSRPLCPQISVTGRARTRKRNLCQGTQHALPEAWFSRCRQTLVHRDANSREEALAAGHLATTSSWEAPHGFNASSQCPVRGTQIVSPASNGGTLAWHEKRCWEHALQALPATSLVQCASARSLTTDGVARFSQPGSGCFPFPLKGQDQNPFHWSGRRVTEPATEATRELLTPTDQKK